MAEIEAEISAEIEQWTPVKEHKLVAPWQCHECLFNITSPRLAKGQYVSTTQILACTACIKNISQKGGIQTQK